jgi:hypothetical protein
MLVSLLFFLPEASKKSKFHFLIMFKKDKRARRKCLCSYGIIFLACTPASLTTDIAVYFSLLFPVNLKSYQCVARRERAITLSRIIIITKVSAPLWWRRLDTHLKSVISKYCRQIFTRHVWFTRWTGNCYVVFFKKTVETRSAPIS